MNVKKGERQAQIIELAKAKGSIRCQDVVQGLGITTNHATVTLQAMTKNGKLKRSGTVRQYSYEAA